MKIYQAPLVIAFCIIAGACSKELKLPLPQAGDGCAHDQVLPPLKPDASARRLLASRSDSPQTAADYYFKLPPSYFSNVENSPERRATLVNQDSLTRQYLHAEHWFECDGGGFEVTIRVFDTEEGPLIAILSSTYRETPLFKADAPRLGELQSICVERPQFWRYREGQWIAVDGGILPKIEKDFVIDRYRNDYKAHLKWADQQKYISLKYELPATGWIVPVTGRENFMDPSETFTWAAFSFNGKRFLLISRSK